MVFLINNLINKISSLSPKAHQNSIVDNLKTQCRCSVQHICITFIQRRPNVFDVGPTLYKRYTNVLCLLGINTTICFRHQRVRWLVQLVKRTRRERLCHIGCQATTWSPLSAPDCGALREYCSANVSAIGQCVKCKYRLHGNQNNSSVCPYSLSDWERPFRSRKPATSW